ncbi:unnamed protein product [Cladocopium goreaui]|uniref:Copia protein (Gag-int-pol protein) [Cleaved into: Copia VLP protein Copia protease ] n=1 Tax=Cladocopium goreaui TaxID=2562237 RepID=A0A9P1GKG4_9DINO|nr:unnamed protein product [Cladocopium goreaui]
MMMQRRRATPEELAQGEDEIRRANQRMEAELASGAEPQLEDKERSEAEVFESPGNPKDKSLGSEEKPKSAPKSFFPPGAEKALQESAAKSSGSAKSVPATPRKTQVSPSERSELQQNPQSAPGSNQAVVLASTEVVKTPETSAAMVVSNVQGMSNGLQYAENDSGRAHQVVSVEATPAAQSNVSSVPLFDESQIRRFQEIYNQAPWLYPGNQLLGPPAMVPQPITRPLFLEQDERRVHGEAVRPPKTEAQDPRSFKAEEAVRPPKHEAEDSRSSQPKEAADPQSQRPKDDGSGANTTFTERSLEFMALMMDSMKEMHKRLNEPKDEGVIKGVETVRSGAPDLPLLAPWEPQQGPLILGDWLLIIEPIISDLSTSASVWWKTSVSAAEAWYKVHMALSPLDRIQHKVETPEEVLQQKWERLERRVATMLLQALPQEVRGELVAARRLTTFGVITHLLVTYSPGGISEKQNLLRNLEDPPEIPTVQDGPAALRRWLRWRHRAKDIGAIAPDPSLQLRGLLKMSKKTLEAHRELQFRVSLVRSGLQVDTVPNDTNVEQFAYHLLAEYEQLSISEKRPGGNATTSKQDATKSKQNEVEKPKAAKLRKLEEDARPKERGESSPQKPKVQKVEGEDTSSTSSKLKEDEGTEGPTMKELLEQEMMDRLQQQLDRMKLKGLKINQINYGSQQGLVDSGATHPLRPMRLGESKNDYKKVSVTLANGESTALQVTPGGVMVSECKDVEPIIPMGMLVQKLGCRVDWNQGTLQIHHPDRGLLPVQSQEGCPQIPRALALELIDELETKALQSKPEEKKFEKEKIWMQALVEAHPVLRQLSAEIKKSLVVDVGSWRDLPVNRRQRRRLQRDGFIAHLYAGESEGFTLTRAYQQQGGNPADILEVDIKRGENHNLLMDSGVYSGLLCAVMSDKVEAFIAGPNCRTRSVLRHYPKENAPRPVRAWGGEEFGLKDLSEQERLQVFEDDVLMWRSSAQLSRWAPGTMNMVAESLMLHVKCQPLKMCPLSWDEHIAHGHTPYRRVLSLDVAGPLIPAKDLGGLRARWMLVGTLTWAVPAESNKLQDAHVPQADGDEPHFEVHPEEEEGAQALEDKREERSEAEEEEGGKVEVWGEEDGEKKEDELSQKPHPVPPYLLPPSQPKDGEKELQPGGFDTKIFRLASPMITKTAREVTRTTMDMLLRLRMDGFHIGRIHSDRGREFAGQFKKWANSRGIALSRTSGDDPRANGRVEVAIKTLKTQVRRLLKAADVGSELWPLAARYADALNRSWRIGEEPKLPPFLQEMVLADDEDPILIKPPALLVEKKYLRRDVYYLPEKAIYGLRRSPRLWGLTRDETISDFSIQGEHNGKHMEFMLEPLQSEPNLWKLRNALEPEDTTLYGLLMTYVDDLMLASSPNLLQAMQAKIQSTWTTSTPEFVGPEPVRFLGMEISKEWKEEFQRDVWMVTQQSYTKDLTQKDPEVKPKRIPLTRDQSAMEPNEAEITPELIRSCQKAVGEVLWLTTRARPDVMYAVSRMGSSSTRAPHAVLAAALQLKGYLMATSDEGLMFNVKEGESPVLTVYTDAGFAPDAQESHGSFVVLLGTTPIFWRSGRQSYITLSTAEAELTEIVEGMIAGESIYVILAELFPVVHKLLKTDSQSALAILSNDGGNWRTRHLRLRCSFARQSILAGEWVIQHVAGEFMIADIGTKPLTAARLEFLKKLMGMGKLVIKDEVKSMEVEEKKEGEKQDGLLTTKEKTKVAEAAQVLRLITLAASIAAAKAEEGEKEHEENYPFEVIIAYTLGIIILTLVAQRIWNAAVRGVIVVRQYVLANLGRLSMNAVRKEEEIPEGDQSESLPASNESRSTDSNDGDQVPPQAPLPIPEDPPSTSEAPRPEQAINVVLQSEATQTGILPGYIANVAQTGIFPGPESEVIQTGIIPGSDSRMTQTGTFPGFNDRDAQTGTIPGHETSALFQGQEERAAALEMLRQHDATMVNYEAEWNQILREEDRVRDELTNAQPGHPILGPMNPPQAEPALPLLPFEVITTRHGTVYHNRLDCRYLTAPMTGHARLHRWCTKCRAEAAQTGRIPGHGFAVLISGREIDFHTDVTCEEAERASTFALCTACLEGT